MISLLACQCIKHLKSFPAMLLLCPSSWTVVTKKKKSCFSFGLVKELLEATMKRHVFSQPQMFTGHG